MIFGRANVELTSAFSHDPSCGWLIWAMCVLTAGVFSEFSDGQLHLNILNVKYEFFLKLHLLLYFLVQYVRIALIVLQAR